MIFNLLTESTQKQFSERGSENALLTFVFTKTGEGWKVTGGDFIDRLDSIFETRRVPQPATKPETVPQTGDVTMAMSAVIAVLAMGAAVVFMKKRAL